MYIYLKHLNTYWTSLVWHYFINDNKTANPFVIFRLNWRVTCYQIESSLEKYNINHDEFIKIAILCIPGWTASSLCASCVAFWQKQSSFLLAALCILQGNVMFWNVLQSCLDIRKCLLRCKDIFSQIQWCLKFA